MEIIFNWLANGIPPWAAYCAFMSDILISLEKQPVVRPVGLGETWKRIFANILLKVTGPEAAMVCHDDQLCAGIMAGIDGTTYGVQAIWDEKPNTEDWVFLLLDAKNAFKDINRVRMMWTVRHLWSSRARFYLTAIVTDHRSFCGTGMGRPVFCIVGRA